MRIRRLQQRARPFRYAAFWFMAPICLALSGLDDRTAWQSLGGAAFCIAWPLLADRLMRRVRPAAAAAGAGATAPAESAAMAAYAGECALVAAVFAWASLPAPVLLAAAACLLGGAAALAGWRLLLPASALLLGGGACGAWLAPVLTGASTPVADTLAKLHVLGFVLAVAHVSFRQAQRLDAHRLALTERSVGLERLIQRSQRYLPPSLKTRLEHPSDDAGGSERRWLTVAFVDLVGFTALAARLDAETLAGVLDEYLTELVAAVERGGGEVSKLLGDGALLVFAPNDRGGDRAARALGALRVCLEVPALLATLEARWRARGAPVRLQMRAGLASGFCTVGDRGGGSLVDFTLIGPPVNLASRLQGHAPVDGVLLDAATAALVEASHTLAGPERLSIRGLGEVLAYGLDAPTPSVMVPPLVAPAATLANATSKDA